MFQGTKYTILRSRKIIVPTIDNLGRQTRVAGSRLSPSSMEPELLEIEESELSLAERNDLRRDPQTRAIATSMPMKLIKPVGNSVVVTPAAGATWGVDAVNAPASPFDGSGVKVAVLDTGIDPNHQAFSGVDLKQRNFTTESDDDLDGHGTHCAGTIFGKDVSGTRIGIARNIKQALIGKVLGINDSSSAMVAQAIQWAVNEGAHVISMSLGIDFPGWVEILIQEEGLEREAATSIALEDYRANINLFSQLASFVEAQSAFGMGCILVAASGNESNRPTYEISVSPPAAGTGIIAVGALQQTPSGLSVANFSNDQVDLSAPGVDVISAQANGGLVSWDGTSMATPHVAGVAALWAQRQLESTGQINHTRLMARLIASGTAAPLANNQEPDNVGSGIVQSPTN